MFAYKSSINRQQKVNITSKTTGCITLKSISFSTKGNGNEFQVFPTVHTSTTHINKSTTRLQDKMPAYVKDPYLK